jgi:hypothetical protein
LAAQRDLVRDLRARGGSVTVLRFETSATDQRAAFETLRRHLDRPRDDPQIIEPSTKAEPKDAAFYRDRYLHERWRDQVPAGAEDLVRIDADLLGWVGYAL